MHAPNIRWQACLSSHLFCRIYAIFLKGTEESNDLIVMIDLKENEQAWQVLNSQRGLSFYSPLLHSLYRIVQNFPQFCSVTVQFSCAIALVRGSLKCIVPTSVPAIAASQFAHKV